MKRGDIYYIQRRNTINVVGEIPKSCPAIIVSADDLNAACETVEVVYLTTNPRGDLPTHVQIDATGIPSTALCEMVDHVSRLLVENYCGTCSPEEMAAIDGALARSLGLTAANVTCKIDSTAFVRVIAERDTYKAILDQVLTPRGVIGS